MRDEEGFCQMREKEPSFFFNVALQDLIPNQFSCSKIIQSNGAGAFFPCNLHH
jgi:hypothetical protein